jgi:hypothetical protein
MKDSFTYENNNIYKNGKIFITLPSKVKKILLLDNCILMLISNDPLLRERNVFCYDLSKQLKWQIGNPIKIHSDNFYTDIYLRDYELYAYSVSGVEYQLDIESGAVLKSELIK